MDQENKRYLSARLKARMKECFDAGLSVVRAPAGFGKSVSVEEYFRRYVSAVSRVFWLTCDGMSEAMYCEKFCDSIAQADAVVTQKLRDAGGVFMGKLSTHEFAIGGPSFDLPWPPARNPWNRDHFCGGSSSGSA